jgi:hypothetical protein
MFASYGPVSEKQQLTGLGPDRDGGKWLCASLKNEELRGHFLRSRLIRRWQNQSGFYFPDKGEAGFGEVGFSEPMGRE